MKKFLFLMSLSVLLVTTQLFAKSGDPGEFYRHYKAAKDGFDQIGKKKPSEKVLFFRKGSSLTKATKNLDKAVETLIEEGETKKNVSNYKKTLKTFKTQKAKFVQVLDKELKAEKKKSDKNNDYIHVMEHMKGNLKTIEDNADA
ncbi:MAG: hypothetical protein JXQ76_00715, partial [Campylobacterales bacterium]|nr:hypothetical protein [Campylobacterales bacterium]